MKKSHFIILPFILCSTLLYGTPGQLKNQPNTTVTQQEDDVSNQTHIFVNTPFKKLINLEKQDLIAGLTQDMHVYLFNAEYTYTNVSFDSVAEILAYQGDLYLFQEVVEVKCDTIPVYLLDVTEPDTNETIVKYYDELTAYKLIKYNPNTNTTTYLGEISDIDPEYTFFEFQDANLLLGKNRWGDVLFEMQFVPWNVKTYPEPEAPIQFGEYIPVYYKNTVLKNDTILYFMSLFENPDKYEVEYFLMRYSFNLNQITDTISLGEESKFHKINDTLFIDYKMMDIMEFDDFGEEYYSIMSNFNLKQISQSQIIAIADMDIVAKQVNAALIIGNKLIMNIQNANNETETYSFNFITKNITKLN